MTQKISVIFSFFNEENCISDAINQVSNILNKIDNLDYELIFINDCSSDNSLSKLVEKSKDNNKIKIINMSRRFGHMPCVLAGLKNSTGDAVIHMDIDLQDPPEIMDKMINVWRKEKCDVVCTQREKFKNSYFNNVLSYVGYKILKKLNYIPIDENAGDFRLISKKVCDEIVKLNETSNFRFLVDFVGFKRKKIFYQRKPRKHGKSKFTLGMVIKNFLEGAFLPFSDSLIRFSFFFGIFCLATTILLISFIGYGLLIGHNFINGPVLFGVILFFLGVQAFNIGVLIVYTGLIFKQTTNRPKYIIESKIGFDD